jgi:glycosyltransferase involved in cell wall biosynthesis
MSNYLVVINKDGSHIGGHKLSSLSLASALHRNGSEVGIVMEKFSFNFPDVDLTKFSLYHSPSPNNWLAAFIRSTKIGQAVIQNKPDVIIAADYESAIYSIPILLLTGLPLIQIQPGGKVPHFPPLRLPGIIVFSEELFVGYQRIYNIPGEYMCVSNGRVDFDYFNKSRQTDKPEKIFKNKGKKILAISRLVQKKVIAFDHLFNQLQEIGDREIIQLVIVGEGECQDLLKQRALETVPHMHPESDITFTGAFRTTPSVLKQADIVVGQGRTVIEAIASGVPASVSGENGYIGLITNDNFQELKKTNFTGRELVNKGKLGDDLDNLKFYRDYSLDQIYEQAKLFYDVSTGIEAIKKMEQVIRMHNSQPGHFRVRYTAAIVKHLLFRFSYYYKQVVDRVSVKRRASRSYRLQNDG